MVEQRSHNPLVVGSTPTGPTMPVSPKSRLRPLIVGESNPYGGDPYFALYPAPDGCSGHRLCCLILGMRRASYLASFDRCNLCDGPWSGAVASDRARQLLAGAVPRFILLGSKVCFAFGVPYRPFTRVGACVILPHPSGRCRRWDVPGAVAEARACVRSAVPDVAHLIGVVGE